MLFYSDCFKSYNINDFIKCFSCFMKKMLLRFGKTGSGPEPRFDRQTYYTV